MSGLYIHIPFCKSKCGYCDFVSFAGCEGYEEAYIDAVAEEAKRYRGYRADTVFIGGGTPGILSRGLLLWLISGIRRHIIIEEGAEFSIETNPNAFDSDTAREFLAVGANRLSVGLQAVQPHLLKTLGRTHTAEDFHRAIETARTAGFSNINADMMYSLPGASIEEAEETARALADAPLTHISAYALRLEPGTPLYGAPQPGEDEDRECFSRIAGIFRSAGYQRYEISNFALPGFACRHNMGYWLGEDYIGLGAAAHSCHGGRRYCNTSSLEEYIRRAGVAEADSEPVEPEKEAIMLYTRLSTGLPLGCLSNKTRACVAEAADKLIRHGLAYIEDDRLILTDAGLDVQNAVVLTLWQAAGL